MNEDHILTEEESRKLLTTVQTVELTGHQLTILANALAFNLVHNDCMMKRNAYSAVYYDECHKLRDYVNSYVIGIIGDNNDKPNKQQPPKKA